MPLNAQLKIAQSVNKVTHAKVSDSNCCAKKQQKYSIADFSQAKRQAGSMCATGKGKHRLCSLSALLLVLVAQTVHVEYARADYENTWNLYYEPPCCTGSSAAHHLRHHKGKSLQLLSAILHPPRPDVSVKVSLSGGQG